MATEVTEMAYYPFSAPTPNTGPWLVQYISDGKGEDREYELSVVWDGCHGRQSWGWSGDNKIILADSDSDYSRRTVNRLRKLAHTLCDDLNKNKVKP